MIRLLILSFCIAGILNFFYLYVQIKKNGETITAQQIIIRLIACVIVVGIGYLLQLLMQLTGTFSGGFVLSVVIPVCIWLWYRINPLFFRQHEESAMIVLCNVLILILITPLLGS